MKSITTLLALLSLPASATVTIDWVTVGNAGNAAQSAANRTHGFNGGDGYGAVGHIYRMSRNETTIGQYAEFLNAVAATDPYGLYSASMASNANIAGIIRSGTSGSYTYSVTGSANRPITYVTWFDAARFANWVQNGQPHGTQTVGITEDGAYNLHGATSGVFTKNPGATVWIPTEDEWYKAAYYDPTKNAGAGGYWWHANQSDTMTSNSPTDAGAANYKQGDYATTPGSGSYSPSQNYLTEVGIYGSDSQSYYATNDQAGNVMEWVDSVNGTGHFWRGGAWVYDYPTDVASSFTIGGTSTQEYGYGGFRLASIPEPTAAILTLLSVTALLRRRRTDISPS